MSMILNLFRPAAHRPRLPADQIDAKYRKMRWQVFAGIFIGYASFYLLRNNFALAMPYLEQNGYTKTQLGMIFSALPLAYGLSKFFMGVVSDRSNPRYFMAAGLLLSALLGYFYGTKVVLSSFTIMTVLMFLNGWVQGMGWPASARVMVHWFSVHERGSVMSVWNIAHNVGGGIVGPLATLGIVLFASWHSIFYFPAIITSVIALLVILLVRDTPQSEGLPPIEEYRGEVTLDAEKIADNERELTTREIFFKYVLINKYLWYLAIANIFVYLVRYGVINWSPSYLTQVKGFSNQASNIAYFLYEYAAIPGTILVGWASDRFFNSRRAPVCIIAMVLVTIGVLFYWLLPPGNQLYNNIALVMIGCFVYGPVSLIGINAVDLVPKKAAGTAAGLTGLLGYLGGAMSANVLIGSVVDHVGWDGGFVVILAACGLAILFLILSGGADTRIQAERAEAALRSEIAGVSEATAG